MGRRRKYGGVNRSLARALLAGTVALIAAALVDPILEGLSNGGAFGRGTFTDHSNWDVVPALLVGVGVFLAWIVLRLRPGLADRSALRWIRRNADTAPTELCRMLPATFLLQIAALFAMESLEQAVVYGHVLGGGLWLGAPAAVSLIAHFAGCVFVSALVGAVARHSMRRITELVERAFAFLRRLSTSGTPRSRRSDIEPRRYRDPLLAGARTGRAPPVLTVALAR